MLRLRVVVAMGLVLGARLVVRGTVDLASALLVVSEYFGEVNFSVVVRLALVERVLAAVVVGSAMEWYT